MPEYFTSPCDPLDLTFEGKSLVVIDSDNCLKQLGPNSEMTSTSAIPVQLSSGRVELRDGSDQFPIELPNIKTQTGGSVNRILFRDSSGAIVNWLPIAINCLDHKMIFRDGSFTFVPDCLPSIMCVDACEITACDEFDYILGLREFELECEDETITILKLVKIPKELIPQCLPEEEVT